MGASVTPKYRKYGALQSRTEDQNYQAECDGIFIGKIGIASGAGMGYIIGYSDDNVNPTFGLGYADVELADGTYPISHAFKIHVKKGEYYRGNYIVKFGSPVCDREYYWRPTG